MKRRVKISKQGRQVEWEKPKNAFFRKSVPRFGGNFIGMLEYGNVGMMFLEGETVASRATARRMGPLRLTGTVRPCLLIMPQGDRQCILEVSASYAKATAARVSWEVSISASKLGEGKF